MVVVWVWFWLVAAAVLPIAAAMLVVDWPRLLDRVEGLADRLYSRRLQRAQVQSVERLAADLHRLAVHLDTVERSQEIYRVARLRAAALAYDDTLRSACRTLQVDVPDGSPLDPVERLQTEAALAQRGLVW